MIHILLNLSVFGIIDARYRKLYLFGISWPSIITAPFSLFLLLLNFFLDR